MPLPPYAPELNPVEQLWLNIKQRYLSNMAFKDYEEIVFDVAMLGMTS